MNDTERKVIAIAEEICWLYGDVVGSRTCQDWEGQQALIDALTEKEKEKLYKEFEEWNSNGRDYMPGEHFFHDGMSVANYTAIALRKMLMKAVD